MPSRFTLINKLFLSLIVFFSISVNAHAVNEMWTSATQSNLSDARNVGDSKYSDFKSRVDADKCSYGDYGIQHAIMYKATGKAAYCKESFNNNAGCKGGATRNTTRDCFVERALSYSICGDAVSSEDKKKWESHLDDVLALVQSNEHGTRTVDTDELVGHYFGGTIYCLARDGNLSKCQSSGQGKEWGGVDVTGDNKKTLRNAIHYFFSKFSSGTWVESSEYNKYTLYYALQGVNAINDFYGKDKFPEITALYDNFADFHVQYHTPDFSENFQFGDVQSIRKRIDHRVRGLYAAMAHLDNDNPEMWYLWDKIYSDKCVRMGWLMFYDHNAPRKAPSGQTDYYAENAGIQLWHEGWESSYDSFYASVMKPDAGVDHNYSGWTNFNLWRKGDWAIHNGKGYYSDSYNEANYLNTMLVNGGLPYNWQEVRDPDLHEEGNNYAYHVGIAGGNSMYSSYYDPPPESLHEWTRSHFYYHHDDGSDTIIVFDRVNSQNPQKLSKYDRHPKGMRAHIDRHDGKHAVLFQASGDPSKIGNRITWFADTSETVHLDSFMPSFSYSEEFMDGSSCSGCGGYMGDDNRTLDYRIVLKSEDKSQHQSFANILHVGSTPVTKEIKAKTGEAAKGYHVKAGVENLIVLFNSEDRTADIPDPTPKENNREKKNWDRFDDLKKLHFFKTGFSISLKTNGDAKVFIMDLDPNKSWNVDVDSSGPQSASVSDAGIHIAKIKGSGDHTIKVHATGTKYPTDSPDFGEPTDPETPEEPSDYVATPIDPIACTEVWGLCANEADCLKAGWYWDGAVCYDKKPVSSCDDGCYVCRSQESCEASASSCHWWSNNTCKDTVESLCANDVSACITAEDCEDNNHFWCNGVCQEDPLTSEISAQDSCYCSKDDTNTLSCSCNVTECKNQIMAIAVAREGWWGDRTPDELTWNGKSAVRNMVGSDSFWWGTGDVRMYYILDPDPGKHNLTVTYGDRASVDVHLGMHTFCGVSQNSPEAISKGNDKISVESKTDNAGIISVVSSIETTNFIPEGDIYKGWEEDSRGFTTALGFYQAGKAGNQACSWSDTQQRSGDRRGSVCASFKMVDSCNE